MKGLVAAVLGLVLAGCAPVAAKTAAAPASPISRWDEGTSEQEASLEATGAPDGAEPALADARTALSMVEQHLPGSFEPEVVHAARIEMAREALVEDNLSKERADVAEELERELAAMQNTEQTSKSRANHAATGTGKKHP